ncbi:ValRS/IleRS/LeuRS editing domain-containing protein [Byssothecium circinans]|uniref:leucine--tRNA ligase n=1 Tax=Byssothecium circinans TaxID=147558 RepID=A0A6A5TH68_9PLEO|nr:ValRS/IleRS/LeuRS editing domain-containing protein [Byssothecium circinans]
MAVEGANATLSAPYANKTEKRDTLVATEKIYQRAWAEAHLFESDARITADIPFGSIAPASLRKQEPKFMGTMAYPYMNGVLHAEHSFTLSKVEFATGYARMQSRQALFPMGFHCTGMAIKACADKRVPTGSCARSKCLARTLRDTITRRKRTTCQRPHNQTPKIDVTRFRSKKGKMARLVKAKYQSQIMLSIGIPTDQIHLFADPYHWVRTFPALDGSKVYFMAATLRPKTIYGQTFCFIGPGIVYRIFQLSDSEYGLITEQGARNMAFQGIFAEWGVVEKNADILGADVVGTVVNAPLSVHERIRILPMETVEASNGTGVVTSVPSDSPDDYATVVDLAKKADYYPIKKEWAARDIIPIIKTPRYGSLIAPSPVQSMKINSPKDTKLPEAKEEAYKEGFYHRTMVYGEFKGRLVSEAKELVKQGLITSITLNQRAS